jgi:hypothetical protein
MPGVGCRWNVCGRTSARNSDSRGDCLDLRPYVSLQSNAALERMSRCSASSRGDSCAADVPACQSPRIPLEGKKPGIQQLEVSYPNFEDQERIRRSFDVKSALAFHNFDLPSPGGAEHLAVIQVSSGLLATLGVKPESWRDIAALEDLANALLVAMIVDHFWREPLASDPHVAGRSVDSESKISTFIGDLAAGFRFFADAEVVMPLRPTMPVIYAVRSVNALAGLARLESGVTTAKAKAEGELNAIQRELDRRYPDAICGVGVEAAPLIKKILGQVRGTILLLFGLSA